MVSSGGEVNPAPTSDKFTYEDFLSFPNDGKRHEIINGEHFVTPSPNTKHQRVSANLLFALMSYLRTHPIGEGLPPRSTSCSRISTWSNQI